jgi:hypothetical protein
MVAYYPTMLWDDLREDVAQIARLRAAGRAADADLVLMELRKVFAGHPALAIDAWAPSAGVPQIVSERATESILTYRPQVARRPLRPCAI